VAERYDIFQLLEVMRTMKQKTVWAVACLWAALLGTRSIAHACSVCITGTSDPTTDAFNWSVLFLMAAPYTVVGSIVGGLFYAYRRAAKREPDVVAAPLVHLALNPEENGR
jgi:hypothetical protein